MELQQKIGRVIVTRVYRDLLNRDPDPGGLDTYMRAILEIGWDERRLRDTIRRSNEFRQLHGC